MILAICFVMVLRIYTTSLCSLSSTLSDLCYWLSGKLFLKKHVALNAIVAECNGWYVIDPIAFNL